jgi:diaminohydroxyphosphoribosylaminopyrimidine deaminase/5-amino-6-(5-phosphoribosylamino)uracil reductase
VTVRGERDRVALATDAGHLARALELAVRGAGRVEPNPRVGAVLVRRDSVVAEGFHREYGGPHAEVEAIRAAGPRARGATLYVTLEPCSRFGKTPPCVEAIARSGIVRVVAGAMDPHPRQRGAGLRALRGAGLRVRSGVLRVECERLNPFVPRVLGARRPWVLIKWAMTLDGKVATASGDSRWVTGEASRAEVHRLRGRVEAILVGIGTAIADDPRLTARPPGPLLPLRVVLDPALRLPDRSVLARTAREAPVLVATAVDAPRRRASRLRSLGVEVVAFPVRRGALDLARVLAALHARGVRRLLVEGGPTVAASFVDEGLVDSILAFVAPKLAGGRVAPSALGGVGIARLRDALAVHTLPAVRLGDDLLIRGFLRREDRP